MIDAMYMFNRQLMWLGLGLVTAGILAFFDYHHWRKLVVPAMAVTIILLITVLLMNEVKSALARNASILGGSVQPSELAKLVSILYLRVWLYAKRQLLHDISLGLIPLGVILGVVGGLIYQQPDLSAAATVLMLGGLLFFLAGGDLKQIGVLLVVAVIAAWIVASISLTGSSVWLIFSQASKIRCRLRIMCAVHLKPSSTADGLGSALDEHSPS